MTTTACLAGLFFGVTCGAVPYLLGWGSVATALVALAAYGAAVTASLGEAP